jgi:membrane protein implicated in regulation of membrane protease activity
MSGRRFRTSGEVMKPTARETLWLMVGACAIGVADSAVAHHWYKAVVFGVILVAALVMIWLTTERRNTRTNDG